MTMALFAVVDGNGFMVALYGDEIAPPPVGSIPMPIPIPTLESGQTMHWDGSVWTVATLPTTPKQQAAAELATRTSIGITITSTGNPSLNALYALDPITMDQVGSVARDAASGLGLPGNQATFFYPDANGNQAAFSATELINSYKAMRDLLFALNIQAAIMGLGGTPVWPAQDAVIP